MHDTKRGTRLKAAIKQDKRSIVQIAKAAGLTYSPVYTFLYKNSELGYRKFEKLETAILKT